MALHRSSDCPASEQVSLYADAGLARSPAKKAVSASVTKAAVRSFHRMGSFSILAIAFCRAANAWSGSILGVTAALTRSVTSSRTSKSVATKPALAGER
jgi:hypothetical protein